MNLIGLLVKNRDIIQIKKGYIIVNSLYPKLLVFLQFGTIFLIVINSKGILHSFLGVSIFVIGAIIGIWAIRHNELGNFNIQPKMKENAKLITTGIYAYIRHPMYLSVIIMMLGFLLSSFNFSNLLLFVFLVFVLYLKAKREENIWCNHTNEYLEYKSKTKLILPFIL